MSPTISSFFNLFAGTLTDSKLSIVLTNKSNFQRFKIFHLNTIKLKLICVWIPQMPLLPHQLRLQKHVHAYKIHDALDAPKLSINCAEICQLSTFRISTHRVLKFQVGL